MRTLFFIAFLASVVQSQGQTYGAFQMSAPAVIAADATTNVQQIIDVRGNRLIGFQIGGKALNTNSTITANFRFAGLEQTFETTTSLSYTLTIPTNSLVVTNITIDTGASAYVELYSLTAGVDTVTNVSGTFAQPAPGTK